MLQAMAEPPAASRPAAQQTRYSADGFWWWDGAQWRPAYSQDQLWRWTGQAWEPAQPSAAPGSGSGAGGAVGIVVGMVLGTILLVGLMALAIIYFAGPQISNVFSNLLGTPNSP
jgi:hypothetical protein